MKRHRYVIWIAAACGVALSGLPLTWAQAESAHAPIPTTDLCSAKNNMTSVVQLRDLAPAKTPEELMQLLRALHDNFLLLDPVFIENANLMRLFGPGEVQFRKPINKWDKATSKDLIPAFDSGLGGAFRVSSTRIPEHTSGHVSFGLDTESSPYTAERIEQYLMPDVQGEDPLAPQNLGGLNENMDAAVRRPRATHPQGYFYYDQIKDRGACRSKLFVRLRKNGMLWDIHLDQEVKK